MEIQILISPSGDATVETVSALEDLWHDYEFFKSQAASLERRATAPNDMFLVKRYRRAALLMLVFYFEGVVNRWLKHLLGCAEWLKVERKPLAKKVRCIEERVMPSLNRSVSIDDAKSIRNALAHLKPGSDLSIFEAVTHSLLAESEKAMASWLTEIERAIGKERYTPTLGKRLSLSGRLLGSSFPNPRGILGRSMRPTRRWNGRLAPRSPAESQNARGNNRSSNSLCRRINRRSAYQPTERRSLTPAFTCRACGAPRRCCRMVDFSCRYRSLGGCGSADPSRPKLIGV